MMRGHSDMPAAHTTETPMPQIQRSALVEHSAARMFHLVNDVEAYPERFGWCEDAKVIERGEDRMVAKLELGIGSFRTWFTTENVLQPASRIDMHLREGPFRRLEGRWQFHALDESASRVELTLDFEPRSRLLLAPLTLGLQKLADRMVDDFIRVADAGGAGG